jgi:hypothetical protein
MVPSCLSKKPWRSPDFSLSPHFLCPNLIYYEALLAEPPKSITISIPSDILLSFSSLRAANVR